MTQITRMWRGWRVPAARRTWGTIVSTGVFEKMDRPSGGFKGKIEGTATTVVVPAMATATSDETATAASNETATAASNETATAASNETATAASNETATARF